MPPEADEYGRVKFEVDTPLELAARRFMGCMGIGTLCALPSMGSGFLVLMQTGSIGKALAGFLAYLLALGLLIRLYRGITCYYVLDRPGRQILYHFGALLVEYEDPVAALDEVVGVGVVSVPDGNRERPVNTFAVVLGLKDGRLQRISDFSYRPPDEQARTIARVLEVPLTPRKPGSFLSVVDNHLQNCLTGSGDDLGQAAESLQAGVLTLALIPVGCGFFSFLLLGFLLVFGIAEKSKHAVKDMIIIDGFRPLSPSPGNQGRPGPVVGGDRGPRFPKSAATILPGIGLSGLVQIGDGAETGLRALEADRTPTAVSRDGWTYSAKMGEIEVLVATGTRGYEIGILKIRKTAFSSSYRTAEGLGIDSSRNEVQEVFGNLGGPFLHGRNPQSLTYPERGIGFLIQNDRVIGVQVFRPAEKGRR